MSGFLIITSFQDHFYETVTVLNQRINAGITNVTCELGCEKSSAGEGNSPTGEIFGWATHMHGNSLLNLNQTIGAGWQLQAE